MGAGVTVTWGSNTVTVTWGAGVTVTRLGHVKRVELPVLRLLKRHHLDVERPRRVVSGRDRVVDVARGIVRVAAGQLVGPGPRQVTDSLVGLRHRGRADTMVTHSAQWRWNVP